MMSPRVSVVLPVYNGEKYIHRAVESIVNQDFADWELLVVDDGSTDGTSIIIGQFSDPRIKYHLIKHSGVAVAANYGIDQCSGEYIARMDSDDYSFPERFTKQVNYLDRNHSVGLVSSLVKYGGDRLMQAGYAHHVDWINSLVTHEDIYLNRFVDSPVANPSLMFRRKLLKQHGLHREGPIPEDYEILLRWLHEGVRFGKVEEELMEWSDYDSRLTRNHDNYSDDSFQKVKAEYFSKWYLEHGHEKQIWVWGNGSSVKRKSSFLADFGLQISGYIDVNPRNQEDVIHYKDILSLNQPLILNYVADRNGRVEIQNWLNTNGFINGSDYWMMA